MVGEGFGVNIGCGRGGFMVAVRLAGKVIVTVRIILTMTISSKFMRFFLTSEKIQLERNLRERGTDIFLIITLTAMRWKALRQSALNMPPLQRSVMRGGKTRHLDVRK